MLTTARVIIWVEVRTSEKFVVPRYAASITSISSLRRMPNISRMPVTAGSPSQLTVTGLITDAIAGIHPARFMAWITIPEIITIGAAI